MAEINQARCEQCAAQTERSNTTPKLEYQGNPIDQSGSLVTVDWGYDIVDRIKASSGLATEIYLLDADHLGIRAELLEILVTRKK